MPSKRCIILIDGSNFYFKLKDLKLHNLLNFDFSSFALELARKDKIIYATYYTGKIKTDGTRYTQRLYFANNAGSCQVNFSRGGAERIPIENKHKKNDRD